MNLLEIITRSNIYLYLLSKYLYQNYLYFFFYEKEFRILKFIKNNDKVILDIGSNNGVSARSIRLFNKKNKIISFEPNKLLKDKLLLTKKKINNFQFNLFGVLDKEKTINLFIPFFRGYCLDSMSSVKLSYVNDSLKRGILQKNLIRKINIKKVLCDFKPIDNYEFNPFFIKIDTEGTEHLVILGLLKTIKKFKPILMVEKNNLNFHAMHKILKKMNYDIYSFRNDKLFKYSLNKVKHENLICINKFNRGLTKTFL
jgi:FkbM family methyltransferase